MSVEPTVQARNLAGAPWWIHECGAAWPCFSPPDPGGCAACHADGPWRQLLVAVPQAQPGGTIPRGQAIPRNVTGVNDNSGYTWEFGPAGWWGPSGSGLTGETLSWAHGPLTVMTVLQETPPPAGSQPAIPADVSDLIQRHGQLKYQEGYALLHPAGGPEVARQHSHAAGVLFEQISGLLLQQPVQARDGDGEPLWIHACGKVVGWEPDGPPPDWACDDDTGVWHPLYVGGGPAPGKAVDHWYRCDEPEQHPQHGTSGRLGRVRCTGGDLLAAVMAELGVALAGDVLITIRKRAGALHLARQSAELRQGRLEAAQAETEKQAAEFLTVVNVLTTQLHETRAAAVRLEAAVSQEIEARDENAEWADRLAAAIAHHLGLDIGEHSNANLPWRAALLALQAAPHRDPLDVRLPMLPAGTAVLVGRARWVRSLNDPTRWVLDDRPGMQALAGLGAVLDTEGGRVRAELDADREEGEDRG